VAFIRRVNNAYSSRRASAALGVEARDHESLLAGLKEACTERPSKRRFGASRGGTIRSGSLQSVSLDAASLETASLHSSSLRSGLQHIDPRRSDFVRVGTRRTDWFKSESRLTGRRNSSGRHNANGNSNAIHAYQEMGHPTRVTSATRATPVATPEVSEVQELTPLAKIIQFPLSRVGRCAAVETESPGNNTGRDVAVLAGGAEVPAPSVPHTQGSGGSLEGGRRDDPQAEIWSPGLGGATGEPGALVQAMQSNQL
jgi:hypothetical protein